MKIYKNKISSLGDLKKPSHIKSILIYGPDTGGVHSILKQLSKKIIDNPDDPFLSVSINSSKIDEDSSIVYDEMMSISFGAEKRLVVVKNIEGAGAIKNAVENVKSLPDNVGETSILIMTAGDIQPSSQLRKLYESTKDKSLIAIPCYKEDAKDIISKIYSLAQAKKIHIDPDASNLLAASCQGDSMIIETEIEKLALYNAGENKITYEDVLNATGNNTEAQIQDVCDAVFSGNRLKIEVALTRAFASGLPPIAILRSSQKYLEKLHQAYIIAKAGTPVDIAIKQIKPPVFFKQIPTFKAHLNKLLAKEEQDIFNKYSHIINAELESKQTNSTPEMIASRALQKIAL